MDKEYICHELEKLPPKRQEEVVDFIRFLASQEPLKTTRRRTKRWTKISEEPWFGMWKDRKDMEDSVEWVRKMRQAEWGG